MWCIYRRHSYVTGQVNISVAFLSFSCKDAKDIKVHLAKRQICIPLINNMLSCDKSPLCGCSSVNVEGTV